MWTRSVFLSLVIIPALLIISVTLLAPQRSFAAKPVSDVPAWLKAYVGEGEGQIAGVVLQRARALYLQKVNEGVVKNSCYFAMDATRPSDPDDGGLGRRFYIICEADHSFRAISAGHGSGRNLKGVADFANGRQCAKNFSNALDSELTAGGAYVTAETNETFKGYYRASRGHDEILVRSFVQFDGEGETANARQRLIGGHAAQVLRGMCRLRNPGSPYADQDGYVPVGDLVDYTAGRSNGCTSWSPSDARQIVAMLSDNPTTLYIYPESRDVDAVARAVATGRPLANAGLYWNASCLKQIGAPKFWPRATLEPIIARFQEDHPAQPPRSLPICPDP